MHDDKNITLNFLKFGSLYFFQRHFYFGDKSVFLLAVASFFKVGGRGGGRLIQKILQSK